MYEVQCSLVHKICSQDSETLESPINKIMIGLFPFMTPKKCLELSILVNFDTLWAWQNLRGYARMILTKF